jgi:predicted DNA-binding transcriptional regulator AlpA
MSAPQAEPTYPPRGLSRPEAARYIGVGVTLFDEMVADGRMPRPKSINRRLVWDRLELDVHFTDLPNAANNAWDLAFRDRR